MNKQILRLAIPNIISNLTVPLLSSVDTALVGHMEEVYYLEAVAMGGMIFSMAYWIFGFLRMGSTGLTAQALGAGNKTEITAVLFRSLALAISLGLLMLLLQKYLADLAFHFTDVETAVEHHAREYLAIRFLAAPATLAMMAIHGWFLGMQNARFPLVLALITNLVNIGANLFFVYSLGMKSEGVAWGTVLAQYSGILLAGILIAKHYPQYLRQFTFRLVANLKELRRLFSLNFDIFLRSLCLEISYVFFFLQSPLLGDNILAANQLLMQFWMLLAFGIDGFAFAAESLVGRFVGARDAVRLRQAVRSSFVWALGLAAVYTLVFAALAEPILYIFTNKPEIVGLAISFVGWVVIAPLINVPPFIWDGIYIGATASAAMRNSMLFSTFLIYIPSFYLFRDSLGNDGLWLAMTIFMLARGITLTVFAKKHIFGIVPRRPAADDAGGIS